MFGWVFFFLSLPFKGKNAKLFLSSRLFSSDFSEFPLLSGVEVAQVTKIGIFLDSGYLQWPFILFLEPVSTPCSLNPCSLFIPSSRGAEGKKLQRSSFSREAPLQNTNRAALCTRVYSAWLLFSLKEAQSCGNSKPAPCTCPALPSMVWILLQADLMTSHCCEPSGRQQEKEK